MTCPWRTTPVRLRAFASTGRPTPRPPRPAPRCLPFATACRFAWAAGIGAALLPAAGCGPADVTDAATGPSGAPPPAAVAYSGKARVELTPSDGGPAARVGFETPMYFYDGAAMPALPGSPSPDYWLSAAAPVQRITVTEAGAGSGVVNGSRLVPLWELTLPIWIEGGALRSLPGIALGGRLEDGGPVLDVHALPVAGVLVAGIAFRAEGAAAR